MTADDNELLADVRAMWHRADPPPPGLADKMIATVAAADLDEELELLVLVRDSALEPQAQVRGVATARVLYFQAVQGWSLDAEIDDNRVTGQLLDFDGDMGSIEVVVETAGGASWSAGLDEVGFFALQTDLTDSVRFTVRQDGIGSMSGWVKL